MQIDIKSAFSVESALFVMVKSYFFIENIEKIKKYDILLIVKELLFHDEKTKSAGVFKTKCTICLIFNIMAIYLSKLDIYNERL